MTGALLGVTLYHASFGFTQAWRVFVSDRRAAGLRGQMLMLALGVVLFFPILAQGTLFGQPVAGLVSPAGGSVLLGAFLFGVGMQLGGGCASGTLFAVGGGNTRMLVTLLFFVVGSVLGTYTFPWWSALPAIKPTLFRPGLGAPPGHPRQPGGVRADRVDRDPHGAATPRAASSRSPRARTARPTCGAAPGRWSGAASPWWY